MPFKPNYRHERAERARNKQARKMEKQEAQAARRNALRDASAEPEQSAPATPELNEDHDGPERANEEEE